MRRVCGWRPVAVFLGLMTAAPAAADPYEVAVLRGLDKVTARVSTIKAPVGETVRFGSLEIVARTCDKTPPEERPEAAAFVDVREVKQGEETEDLYRGWMFASSPALAAIDHPVYDIWVLDCVDSDSVSSDSTAASAASEGKSE